MQTVGEGKVDQPVRSGKGHSPLGAILGQWSEAFAAATGQHQGLGLGAQVFPVKSIHGSLLSLVLPTGTNWNGCARGNKHALI